MMRRWKKDRDTTALDEPELVITEEIAQRDWEDRQARARFVDQPCARCGVRRGFHSASPWDDVYPVNGQCLLFKETTDELGEGE